MEYQGPPLATKRGTPLTYHIRTFEFKDQVLDEFPLWFRQEYKAVELLSDKAVDRTRRRDWRNQRLNLNVRTKEELIQESRQPGGLSTIRGPNVTRVRVNNRMLDLALQDRVLPLSINVASHSLLMIDQRKQIFRSQLYDYGVVYAFYAQNVDLSVSATPINIPLAFCIMYINENAGILYLDGVWKSVTGFLASRYYQDKQGLPDLFQGKVAFKLCGLAMKQYILEHQLMYIVTTALKPTKIFLQTDFIVEDRLRTIENKKTPRVVRGFLTPDPTKPILKGILYDVQDWVAVNFWAKEYHVLDPRFESASIMEYEIRLGARRMIGREAAAIGREVPVRVCIACGDPAEWMVDGQEDLLFCGHECFKGALAK